MQRKAVVLALILLGHSRQPIDVEAPLCKIFRQAPGAIHPHDGVQRPLPAVRKDPFLFLQDPGGFGSAWRFSLQGRR